MKSHVTDYTLYARRYALGIFFLCILVLSLVLIAAIAVPGSLREAEMQSSLNSGALSLQSINPESIINMPYYLLQRLSFSVFGVSTLSIKLPSVILGTLMVIGIYVLTRTWLRRNVAVITTAITATAAQFLFLSQDGTPLILFPFICVWLLVASTFITRARYFVTLWKVLTCVLMAAALYVPLGIYLVATLMITASLHPHIRYVIRRVSRPRLIVAIVLGLASVAPLVYAIIVQPSIGLTLLGIPTDGLDITKTAPEAIQTLFGFFSVPTSALLRPLYPLGLTILICLGIFRLIRVRHTAQSYTVIILGAFLMLLTILKPEHATALFPIMILLVALAISYLIRDWYKLFPRNPYARISGLVVISVMVFGLMLSGSTRYLNNYTYNPHILVFYSTDLSLLETTIKTQKPPVDLLVSADELPFYELVARYNDSLRAHKSIEQFSGRLIVTKAANGTQPADATLETIVTNQRSANADRFYIYKNPST